MCCVGMLATIDVYLCLLCACIAWYARVLCVCSDVALLCMLLGAMLVCSCCVMHTVLCIVALTLLCVGCCYALYPVYLICCCVAGALLFIAIACLMSCCCCVFRARCVWFAIVLSCC